MSYYARIKAIERKQTKPKIPDFTALDLISDYLRGKITEEEYRSREALLPEVQITGDFSALERIAIEIETAVKESLKDSPPMCDEKLENASTLKEIIYEVERIVRDDEH